MCVSCKGGALLQVEHVVGGALEGQLQRGAGDHAAVRRPVAVRAAPQLRDDQRAAQRARDRQRLPDLRRAAAGPSADGCAHAQLPQQLPKKTDGAHRSARCFAHSATRSPGLSDYHSPRWWIYMTCSACCRHCPPVQAMFFQAMTTAKGTGSRRAYHTGCLAMAKPFMSA